MLGVITTKSLILHGHTIIREFGLKTYIRCVVSALRRQRRTFLQLEWETKE